MEVIKAMRLSISTQALLDGSKGVALAIAVTIFSTCGGLQLSRQGKSTNYSVVSAEVDFVFMRQMNE